MKLVSFYSGEKHLKYSRCFVKTFWLNSNQTLVDWVEKFNHTDVYLAAGLFPNWKILFYQKRFRKFWLCIRPSQASHHWIRTNLEQDLIFVHQHHHISSDREKRCIGSCIPANQEKDIKSSNFAILLQFFLALNWKVNNFLRSKGINILYFQIA